MDGGPDPMEEQLRRIRAEKQAKYEAEMAQQRREDTPPPSENKVQQTVQRPQAASGGCTLTLIKVGSYKDESRCQLSQYGFGECIGQGFSGIGSGDLDEAMRISRQTALAERDTYENLENQLVSRGLRIEEVANDVDGHADLRAAVVAHMIENRERFEPFVTDDFEAYIATMSCLGEYGTNLEIQALSEIQGRSIEVYNDKSGGEPMNTFQGSHLNPNPLRLSYHRGNHYNAVLPINSEEFVIPPTSFGQFNSEKK